MKQGSKPSEWAQEYESNVGVVTILTPPMKPPQETGLKAPYQYALTLGESRALQSKLKSLCQQQSKALQCSGCDTKSTKYGCRLSIFLLGYRPNYTGEGGGVTKAQWEAITGSIDATLKSAFPNAPFYCEPWTATDKFQARFETYIFHT